MRSCHRNPAYPWISPRADLAEARKLIETCGYGRRLGELEDAQAALQALTPAESFAVMAGLSQGLSRSSTSWCMTTVPRYRPGVQLNEHDEPRGESVTARRG
jgi:hypothetical protein